MTARIGCVLESIRAAGDHHFAVGRVREPDAHPPYPLMFLPGGFGASRPPEPAGADPDRWSYRRGSNP